MDNGGTLDNPILGHFAKESCEDWPLPFSFNDHAAVDFNLVPLDCDGFMTDFRFLMNEILRNDDM